MKRMSLIVAVVIFTAIFVALINFITPLKVSNTLTGFEGQNSDLTQWVTVHFFIWLSFWGGIAIVANQWLDHGSEKKIFQRSPLNREDGIVYEPLELRDIYSRAALLPETSLTRNLIQRSIAQFQSSKSWSQTNEILKSKTDELLNRVELKYTTVKYLTWLIPTLGFIGTVVGIANALAVVGQLTPADFSEASFLPAVVAKLGVAFTTTLVALVLSAILIFFTSLQQAADEELITNIFGDCLDNLLNKLHLED